MAQLGQQGPALGKERIQGLQPAQLWSSSRYLLPHNSVNSEQSSARIILSKRKHNNLGHFYLIFSVFKRPGCHCHLLLIPWYFSALPDMFFHLSPGHFHHPKFQLHLLNSLNKLPIYLLFEIAKRPEIFS